MRRQSLLVISLALAACMVVGSAYAAPPKPKVKPKPKTATGTGTSMTTTQLPGGQCDFGKNYTLGKKDGINFCVKSVEYRVQRIFTGDRYAWPQADRKLLIVHGTVQNPMPNEKWVAGGSFRFTAIDGDSQNNESSYICLESSSKQVDQSLKPAQKLEVFVVFDVTAKGEIPKLMIANNSEPDAPVARYDLRGKTKGVEELYRDATDKTNTTAKNTIEGVVGKAYESGNYNVKVEAVAFSDKSFTEDPIAEGYVSVVVTFEVTSYCEQRANLGPSNAGYEDSIIDADGATYGVYKRSLAVSSDREVNFEVDQGKSVKFRSTYQVPKGVQLKNLKIVETNGRTLLIDLSTYKAP